MKVYFESRMRHYSTIFPDEASVASHLFSACGNGVDLDSSGYITANQRCGEPYVFPEPKPLDTLSSWAYSEDIQAFRRLAGCRDVGFEDAAKYFIECVKLTDDSVMFAKEWKDNIHMVEDVLLNTPPIVDEYDSTKDYNKFVKNLPAHLQTNTKALPKRWFMDVTAGDEVPDKVKDEVLSIWATFMYGNDNFVHFATVDVELFEEYPNLYFWCVHKGIPRDDTVIIHRWW